MGSRSSACIEVRLECRKIGWRGSEKRKLFARARMSEAEALGVEELAGNFSHAGERVYPAVDGIAGDGATCLSGVNADLVCAAGVKIEFEEAGSWPGGDNFPIGFGGSAASANGHALASDGMASDGPFPSAGVTAGASENEGNIGFFCFTIAELATELAVGGVVFRGNDETGGFAVESVDDSWTIGATAWGELAVAVMEEGGGERAGGAPCAWVDVHASGFIEDENIGVFVNNG